MEVAETITNENEKPKKGLQKLVDHLYPAESNKPKSISDKEHLLKELEFGESFPPLGLSPGTQINSLA